MDETSKSKKIWGPVERSVLTGKGIDIGCGPDPVTPSVRRFDIEDGDANQITNHIHEEFDFVYASHCLEHMHDPVRTALDWWKLVKPGGYIFIIVPDEDLYEQGVFPSRFNPDHKATFTISKSRSWSPVSINLLRLAQSLPNGELVSLELQDQNYDRSILRHAEAGIPKGLPRLLMKAYRRVSPRFLPKISIFENWQNQRIALDQTWRPETLAQIQLIVQKRVHDPASTQNV